MFAHKRPFKAAQHPVLFFLWMGVFFLFFCLVCLFLKQFNSKTRDGFTVNSKVPSLKDPGKEYDGFTITITGDRCNLPFSVFNILKQHFHQH